MQKKKARLEAGETASGRSSAQTKVRLEEMTGTIPAPVDLTVVSSEDEEINPSSERSLEWREKWGKALSRLNHRHRG